MATEKSALRVSELDFDTIKENLKTYLRAQNEFQDFDFDGAGMNVLLDILAYNTHYMAYQLNMVGNEMFLDTAQLRASVLSHAKHMNYVPGSSEGALAKVNISITPSLSEDQNTNIITLEKYTRLLGADKDGINYPFVTLYSNTISKSGNSFTKSNVFIKQGEVVTLQYLMESTNESRRFEIPSMNVDTSSVTITVQESSSNTDTVVYTEGEDITELTANSKIYFLEENENQKYTFYFGDDVIGKKPKNGNIIICTYLDTIGSISNNISRFTFVEPIGGLYSDNVVISTANSSYGGVEKETIEQVRYRAPYFYSTQNRAVTSTDYETLLIKDYNYIDSVSVWGGEDEDPPVYGKVFVSVKTKGNYALTNLEKERLKTELIQSRNILTVTPEIIDPDYVYLIVTGKVHYNQRLTSLTASELETYVSAAIQDYAEIELSKFNSVFRQNDLEKYILNAEKSITGVNLDIYAQKRILIDITSTKNYDIDFNFKIAKPTLKEKISTYPELELNDAYGISRDSYIEEVPELKTGISKIHVTDGGSGYITAPTVTISGDGSGATAVAKILAGRVSNITITNAGQNYTSALVSISGAEGSGAAGTVVLQEIEGTLRSIYYKTDGEKVMLNNNIGTVNYEEGTVTLNGVRAYSVSENDFYNDNYLTLTVPLCNCIISPLRNRIITFDANDPKSIQITMVAE